MERKFSQIARLLRGLTYSPSDVQKAGVRVLRSSNICNDSFVLGDDDVFVRESAVNIEKVEDGNILITAANGSSRLVGKHAIVKGVDNFVHGGFMLLAKADNPYFLHASMSSSWYRSFINIFVSGGNGAIGNLRLTDLDCQAVP
ncbi:MAG: hypothetical protein MR890_07770, partial [Akkermansia muciniphila]|nr:hypothetical protein [Akkermansia muciniphila]